jgi:hypothetical protein
LIFNRFYAKAGGIHRMRLRFIAISLLSLCLFGVSCIHSQGFTHQLNAIIKPYCFSITRWEFKTIGAKLWVFGKHKENDNQTPSVTEYFSLVERINGLKSKIAAINAGNKPGDLASLEAEINKLQTQRADLSSGVESIIAGQIKEVLAEEGIFNPVANIRLKVNFPPLDFNLEPPPRLLVISPRDRIESMREITLQPDLSLEEMESIEEQVDKLGVSSLVVELGGLGATYPTFVADNSSLQFTISTATEEWLHQYLAFKPLGFLYLLDLTGVSRNYEIATINETVASMVSKEIGDIVIEKYYPGYENNAQQEQEPGFDFNREMREIRSTVDIYLAKGQIAEAEAFMEQKRQYLASMGYLIRKLNQAYFAFYGTYADSPTSISPIGAELKQLRERSASLKDFLNTVVTMTSRQELAESVK